MVTVFTCVVGATPDTVRMLNILHNPAVRYVCLSDRRTSPFPYQHVPVTVPAEQSAHLYARQLKILADHPALGESEVLLWHDAAFRLDLDPAIVARVFREDSTRQVVAFAHPDRTTVEEEAAAIVRCGYMDEATVTAQVAHYRSERWPTQTALTTTGYLLRRRTEAVRAFNQAWWDEVARWGYRDQMSVDYALWKTGLTCHYLAGSYRANRYARWVKAPFVRRPPHRPMVRP